MKDLNSNSTLLNQVAQEYYVKKTGKSIVKQTRLNLIVHGRSLDSWRHKHNSFSIIAVHLSELD